MGNWTDAPTLAKDGTEIPFLHSFLGNKEKIKLPPNIKLPLTVENKPTPVVADEFETVWEPVPNSSQEFAIDTRAHHTLYCGARGPGKTVTQLMRFRRFVGLGYGMHWKGIIFDREFKHLSDLVAQSNRFFPQFNDGCLWFKSAADYKWTWPTGEELLFRHVKSVEDYDAFHGWSIQFLGWNELTKWPTLELYDKMMSINRSSFVPEKHTPKKRVNGVVVYDTQDGKPLPPIPLEVFSTTNPYGPGHCLPHGDVLTAYNGWIDIRNLKIGDWVISVDSNGISKPVQVTNVICEQFQGDMVCRKGRGINMEFTPMHRLPLVSEDGKNFKLRRFCDLPKYSKIKRTANGWSGVPLINFEVPFYVCRKTKLEQPDTLTGSQYANLMGWFLSEGCTVDIDKSFHIAQTKESSRDFIELLLQECGFVYTATKQQFSVHSPKWWNYLRQFGKCRDKFVPIEIKNSTLSTLHTFFNSMICGDGHWENETSCCYYTISKQLADDMAEIGVKLGYRVYMSSRIRKDRNGLSYTISFSEAKDLSFICDETLYSVQSENLRTNIERIPFCGNVYCITVPETETFFIRQNGCVWLSGNSAVKKRFIDVAKYGEIVRNKISYFDPIQAKEITVERTQVAIFGSFYENPYLDPIYRAGLIESCQKDPHLKAAWIDGDWSVSSGGACDDLWEAKIHIVDRFKVPVGWRVDRTFDWGSSAPFSVVWWAEANGEEVEFEDGRKWCPARGSLIAIADCYGTENIGTNKGLKLGAEEICDLIIEEERILKFCGWISDKVKSGPADNQIRDVREVDVDTIELKMAKKGISWTESDKSKGSRIIGLQLFRDRLRNATIKEGPAVYFTRNCQACIEIIPNLPRDPDKPEDVDSDAEDHIWDAVRYRVLKGSNRWATTIITRMPY